MSLKNLYLNNRSYYYLIAVIVGFLLSYMWAPLFLISQIALVLFFAIIIAEVFWLNGVSKRIRVERDIEEKLSLAYRHPVVYNLEYHGKKPKFNLSIIDQYPEQLQLRDARINLLVDEDMPESVQYTIRPTTRGLYHFGDITLLLRRSFPGLVLWKKREKQAQSCKVYPNIIEMKEYGLQIFSKTAAMYGIRNIRKVGQNDEFELIRSYQEGDHVKMINWKASSRKGELLVNQYQDTRSQHVYAVIDKGRTMEMPFEGMSLLDYSINSALAISNVVLRKSDKMGLISFGKKVDELLLSNSKQSQLNLILEGLYQQETKFEESGFESLYYSIRNRINTRSIIFLFSNFLSEVDMDRNLKYLQAISKRHLLVFIAFENSELVQESQKKVEEIGDIYDKTIAMEMLFEKREILIKLQSKGIQTILTSPEKLSFDVINKYLEIKAKRMK